jgi:LacI family transcriptional regulator
MKTTQGRHNRTTAKLAAARRARYAELNRFSGGCLAEGPQKLRGAGPLGRRPTIHDVARSAAVSPATVSNVLTGRRHVDPELARRVRTIVDELGYRRDVAASALRSTQRTVVGVIVPMFTNPFFAELVDRLEREARAAGKRLVVTASDSDPEEEARQIEALTAWRPAGVIAVPCDGTFAARQALDRDGVPYVVIDRPLDGGVQVDTVAVDNVAAAAAGTRGLLAMGHRRLLVVASSTALGNIRERLTGIDAAIAAFPGAHAEVIEAGFDQEEIAGNLGARLANGSLPTAIFALNNGLTLGTLKAIGPLGLKIPQDLSLLGFDDYDWMAVFQPPLSAIRQPVAELAQAAWQRLAALTGAAPLAGAPALCHVRLPCSLVWRGSVAPPRTSASARDQARQVAAAITGRMGS